MRSEKLNLVLQRVISILLIALFAILIFYPFGPMLVAKNYQTDAVSFVKGFGWYYLFGQYISNINPDSTFHYAQTAIVGLNILLMTPFAFIGMFKSIKALVTKTLINLKLFGVAVFIFLFFNVLMQVTIKNASASIIFYSLVTLIITVLILLMIKRINLIRLNNEDIKPICIILSIICVCCAVIGLSLYTMPIALVYDLGNYSFFDILAYAYHNNFENGNVHIVLKVLSNMFIILSILQLPLFGYTIIQGMNKVQDEKYMKASVNIPMAVFSILNAVIGLINLIVIFSFLVFYVFDNKGGLFFPLFSSVSIAVIGVIASLALASVVLSKIKARRTIKQ